MSRYRSTNKTKEIVYGWDHALGYFYDTFDLTAQESDGTPLHLDEGSSFINRMNRGQFLEILEEFDIPQKHRMAIAADLPF